MRKRFARRSSKNVSDSLSGEEYGMTHLNFLDSETDALAVPQADDGVIIEVCSEGRFRAVVEDLGFMWRWNIYRDGEMCQEGCSLSENSSREAVRHVLAFYRTREESAAAEQLAESP
jgi:soluble methane monooxygenase-binding protein MmoD